MGLCGLQACDGKWEKNALEAIKDSMEPGELIIVVTGTHGSQQGGTGAANPDLIENDFYQEDKKTIRELGIVRCTTLLDAADVDESTIDYLRSNGIYNGTKYQYVVLAYCHGKRGIFRE
nr:hypothetical protein [Paludibacterium sp. B53371]